VTTIERSRSMAGRARDRFRLLSGSRAHESFGDTAMVPDPVSPNDAVLYFDSARWRPPPLRRAARPYRLIHPTPLAPPGDAGDAGYSVGNTDHDSRSVSLQTGMSWRSWSGQAMTATVLPLNEAQRCRQAGFASKRSESLLRSTTGARKGKSRRSCSPALRVSSPFGGEDDVALAG